MEVFKVKKNSWHKPLCDSHCKWMVPYIISRDLPSRTRGVMSRDFCSYFRGITIYLVKFFMVAFLIGIILTGIPFSLLSGSEIYADTPFIIALGMMLGWALWLLIQGMVAVFLFGAVSAGLIEGIKYLWKKFHKDTGKPKQSMIITKYKSWKDKYCPAIEFE